MTRKASFNEVITNLARGAFVIAVIGAIGVVTVAVTYAAIVH